MLAFQDVLYQNTVNSLPDSKILVCTKSGFSPEKEIMLITNISSFSHNVFNRLLFLGRKRLKVGICSKGLTLYYTIPTFKEAFSNQCWKRRKCWYQAFSPFPTIFSTLSRREIVILITFDLSSANAMNLVSSKYLSCGKE